MVSTKKSLAVLSLLVVPSAAFTAPINHQSLKRARVGPLHSFEVMETVGATHAPIMSTVNQFFQTQPYLAAFLTCSFKASAADMIAQTKEFEKSSLTNDDSQVIDDTNSVNISRNLGFLFYGGIYQGMAQNFIYNTIYPNWFGTDDSLALIAKEVLVDNLLFAPFLCLPVAYFFKTAFTSEEPLGINTLQTGMEKYKHDVMTNSLLLRYWSIWFPCNLITFGVIPPHYRVVFVAAISFFWICMLSSIASSEDPTTEETNNTMPAMSMDQ